MKIHQAFQFFDIGKWVVGSQPDDVLKPVCRRTPEITVQDVLFTAPETRDSASAMGFDGIILSKGGGRDRDASITPKITQPAKYVVK